MTYGSVCSGIEAPGLAWEPLGMEALWFSEIEKFPSAVLSHHWPDVVNLGDFTSKESWGYMKDHPPDILFGGTPCQAFSVAGQRKSLDDDRGNLSLMFTELWHELRTVGTRYAVWENVPGVLNTEDNAFGCFLSGMVGERNTIPAPRSGWTNSGMVSGPEGVVAWVVKDAQHYGVPQRRRRVFAIVGHPGDFSPAEILFKPEGLSGDIATSKESGEEVARGVGTGSHWDDITNPHPTITKLALQVWPEVGTYYDGSDIAATQDASLLSKQQMMPEKKRMNCVIEQKAFVTGTNEQTHVVGYRADGRSRNDATVSYTVDSYPGSHAIATNSMVVRRLTPVECERLQGMPDNWTRIPWRGKPADECPDGPRYKAIGNSIAVPCLRWIGERML